MRFEIEIVTKVTIGLSWITRKIAWWLFVWNGAKLCLDRIHQVDLIAKGVSLESRTERVLQLILIYARLSRKYNVVNRKPLSIYDARKCFLLQILPANAGCWLCCCFVLPAVMSVYLWNEVRIINISDAFLRGMYFLSTVSSTYRKIDRTKDT